MKNLRNLIPEEWINFSGPMVLYVDPFLIYTVK